MVRNVQAAYEQGELKQAQKDLESLSDINKIHFHVNGTFKYTYVNGLTHDWSKNGGIEGKNDNNTSIKNPHSSFFIQMDTFLPSNMPFSWVVPGNGPSTIISTTTPTATVSSDGNNGDLYIYWF